MFTQFALMKRWVYELCLGEQIRQFHEVSLVDRISGVATVAVESEHILGRYTDEITRENEWKHIVNSTFALDKQSGGHRSIAGAKDNPYFVEEYRFGDVCDHEDVTDSAIKAGEVGEGHIERSATVRYSCGTDIEMNVREDSTCHYVVDVTVPALCAHPAFQVSVMKKHVLKCLETP